MKKLLASAASLEDLAKIINDYFYSKNYIIQPGGSIYNTKTKKTLTNYRVRKASDRFRFEWGDDV